MPDVVRAHRGEASVLEDLLELLAVHVFGENNGTFYGQDGGDVVPNNYGTFYGGAGVDSVRTRYEGTIFVD